MPFDDTIAALATPPGVGGLCVLRLSGPQAIDIAARLFRPFHGRSLRDMPGYTAAYGHLREGDTYLDDAVLTLFRAPHSYTGEDVCELSCHGGDYLARRVLTALIRAGARPALAGEFTKRAFLAGKMDLTRAESVIELIEAEGDAALRLAHMGRRGHTGQRIDALCDRLIETAAALGAYADYPDEDLGETDPADLCARLEVEMAHLSALTEGYDAGQIVRRGVSTAILGRPNVGKSSLMNRLFGARRSIVTDIPGTTRDVVEAEAMLGGMRFILADTAGLRDTADPVEAQGVALSYEKLAEADLLLCLIDASQPLCEADRHLLAQVAGRRALVVLNKCDQGVLVGPNDLGPEAPPAYILSAQTGQGVDELVAAMVASCALPGSADNLLLANRRQLDCALRAREALCETCEALRAGVTLDAVATLLDGAIAPLLELTGRRVNDSVIDTLFARFCVGK